VSRWKNVIAPYLFCSIPALLHAFVFRYGVFENVAARSPLDVAADLGFSLVTAQHMFVPFWFIPTITLLYLAAPALLWIDRRPKLYALVPVALVVGSMVHLSPLYLDVVRDAADVLPVYVAGMALHRFQAEVFGALRRFPLRAPLAVVALTLAEVAFGEPGRFSSRAPFSTEGGVLDFGYLQKALLSLWVLERLEAWRPAAAGVGRVAGAALGRLADLSFGVFFGHMYVQSFLLVPAMRALSLAPRAGWLGVVAIGVAVLAATTALIVIAKRVLGARSRVLIGC
jgi:surface polysaccharide O-acyltransferase-like enzyme